MNRKNFFIVLMLISNMQFVSCIKQDECLPPRLEVSYKPIYAGESIRFAVISEPGVTYSWIGPGGFISTVESPVINAATISHAGVYQVTANKGSCSTVVKVEVEVMSPPPCTPANNTISFGSNMSFSSAVFRMNAVGNYEIYASGSQGEFQVSFYTDIIKKGDFIYELSTMNADYYNAFMQIDVGGVLANWQAISGKLYVKWINGKPVITFCSANFNCLQGDYRRLGTGKITAQ